MTVKIRRKYIPCYVVLRVCNQDSYPPHVMGVFEHFDQAETMVCKYDEAYKKADFPFYCEIQPADYCTA